MDLTPEQIAEIAATAATEAVEKLKKTEPSPLGDEGEEVEEIPKFKSFGEQLIAVAQFATGQGSDPRLKATGLSEAIPSEGGYFVQQEFIDTLMEKVWQTGVIAAKCAKQTVGAGFNGIKMPRLNETARADESRWGGIYAYWKAEGGTKLPSKPAFGMISMELEKLIGLCYMTDELMQDATALESYIKRWFPLEFGFRLDDAIIRGDGSGKPLGILNSPALVTVSEETGQSADTILAENIIKMWARMYAPCRKNAIWLINQDIEPELFTMVYPVGTGGIPVYMPANGLAGQPYGTLMGRPVMPIEQCATVGDVGDIILADLSQYLLIEKGGIQAASSIHVQFTTDETAFRFVYRVNGQPLWASTLAPFKGAANTQSPFVVIETRGA